MLGNFESWDEELQKFLDRCPRAEVIRWKLYNHDNLTASEILQMGDAWQYHLMEERWE